MHFNKNKLQLYKDKKPNEDQAKRVKKDFIDKLKKFIGKIPFALDAVALYMLFTDDAYPLIKKGIAVFALFYFIIPIDAIPDILPGIGLLDDAAAIALAIKIYGNDIKPYKEKANEWLKDNGFR